MVTGVLACLKSSDGLDFWMVISLKITEFTDLELASQKSYVLCFEVHLLDFSERFDNHFIFEFFSSKLVVEDKVDSILHFFCQIVELRIGQLVLGGQILEGEACAEQVHALQSRAVVSALYQEVLHDCLYGGGIFNFVN